MLFGGGLLWRKRVSEGRLRAFKSSNPSPVHSLASMKFDPPKPVFKKKKVGMGHRLLMITVGRGRQEGRKEKKML